MIKIKRTLFCWFKYTGTCAKRDGAVHLNEGDLEKDAAEGTRQTLGLGRHDIRVGLVRRAVGQQPRCMRARPAVVPRQNRLRRLCARTLPGTPPIFSLRY